MLWSAHLWRQVKISPRTSDASCISDMLKRGVVAEPPSPPPPSASSASRSSDGLTAQLRQSKKRTGQGSCLRDGGEAPTASCSQHMCYDLGWQMLLMFSVCLRRTGLRRTADKGRHILCRAGTFSVSERYLPPGRAAVGDPPAALLAVDDTSASSSMSVSSSGPCDIGSTLRQSRLGKKEAWTRRLGGPSVDAVADTTVMHNNLLSGQCTRRMLSTSAETSLPAAIAM